MIARGSVTRPPLWLVFCSLLGLLLGASLVSTMIGAAGIPLSRLAAALGLGTAGDAVALARDELVLWSIRLPRIALGAMIGAMLAAAGVVMQGVFRNPLADPALVGVSSGAALAAALTIVAGDRFLTAGIVSVRVEILPVAAFAGALAATIALYRLATAHGRTSIAIFLLGGIAIAALVNACIGLLVFVSDDRQLRDLTFWMLGSFAGATWVKVLAVLPFFAGILALFPAMARGLDPLILGEAEAFHMGVAVERLKRISIAAVALAVGAAVSVSGIIGFVGIVVPHLLRMIVGPGHRALLPGSALLGAAMTLAADAIARTLAAPAELPIGVVTAAIGAPFFLVLLLRQRSLVAL